MGRRILKRPRLKPVVLMATVFVFALFVIVLNQNFWAGTGIREASGTVNFRQTQWQLAPKDGSESQPIQMNEHLELEPGKIYEITGRLSYDGSGDESPCGFLSVDHMFCRVYLDDQLLFSYMPEDIQKWDRSRSPGFVCGSFPLTRECLGRELRMEILPALRYSIQYQMPRLVMGDYRAMNHAMILWSLPNNIITVLCMVLGLSALIFSAASLTGSDYREGFNIGTFTLLVSLYFLTECKANCYFFANPYYLYFVNFLVISLMPVSFMGVMRECMEGREKKICTGVIAVEMTFFLLELSLHFMGILDMREMLPLIHVMGFAELLTVSGLFLCMKDRKKMISLQLQMTPIIIGMAADAIIYWRHLDMGMDEATSTTTGVLIFLANHMGIKLFRQARKLVNMQQHTIEGMATLIEGRDGSTGAHVRNTGVYARMIAEEMYHRGMYPKEIDSEFVDMIGRMAPLHDVGKIKISDTILNKPGRFTPEEYAVMKTHAALGGEIIRDIMKKDLEPEMLEMAVNIATYHHERWDGNGYPTGKKGTEIPLCARIMAAADVFDALSSKRVYKPEMDIDQVFHEMEINKDKQFQKEIVDVVIDLRPRLEVYLQKARKKAAQQERKKVSI